MSLSSNITSLTKMETDHYVLQGPHYFLIPMQCPARRARSCFGHLRDMHLLDLLGQSITDMPIRAHREGNTRGLGDLAPDAPYGNS